MSDRFSNVTETAAGDSDENSNKAVIGVVLLSFIMGVGNWWRDVRRYTCLKKIKRKAGGGRIHTRIR